MKRLYEKRKTNDTIKTPYEIHSVALSLLKRTIKISGERLSIRAILVRIYLAISGKNELFYVVNDSGELIHTSRLAHKCFRFSFLGKNDCEIGSCWTREDMRGRGIYPAVLQYIVSTRGGGHSLLHDC